MTSSPQADPRDEAARAVAIPLSEPGTSLDPRERLADGVYGYAIESDGAIYIPFIGAETEGDGRVGRFLDALPREQTIKFPNVMSARLAGMLARRGFSVVQERDEMFYEDVPVFVRAAALSKAGGQSNA